MVYSLKSLRKREFLLAALASLGYSANKVEVHDTPVSLYGYAGDKRKEVAHIVIRKQNTGVGSSNDIGFVLGPDGCYQPIVSEYDNNALQFDANTGKRATYGQGVNIAQATEAAYGRIVADKSVATLLRTTIPRMKARGLIPHNATALRIQDGATTKVVVRYSA